MAWYKTGSIKATQNSNVVTGTGTDWKNNLYGIGEGQALVFGNNRVEIAYVVSNTELRLAEPYKGATYNGNYHIENMFAGGAGDYVRQISAAIRRFAEWGLDLNEWFTSQSDFIEIKDPVGNIVKVPTMTAQLKKGDFGLGSNAIYDGSIPSAQTPKDADDITSTGFYAGGGSSALNYFNNYYPLLSLTRTGGDGTGYVTHIQGTNNGLGFRHRVQNKWSIWYECLLKNVGGIQWVDGEVRFTDAVGAVSRDEKNSAWLSLTRTEPDMYVRRNGVADTYKFPDTRGGKLLASSKIYDYKNPVIVEKDTSLALQCYHDFRKHYMGLRDIISYPNGYSSGFVDYKTIFGGTSTRAVGLVNFRNWGDKSGHGSCFQLMSVGGDGVDGYTGLYCRQGVTGSDQYPEAIPSVFKLLDNRQVESVDNAMLNNTNMPTMFFRQGGGAGTSDWFSGWGSGINLKYDWNNSVKMFFHGSSGVPTVATKRGNELWWNVLWGSANTTTDSNGFIKKASPIIKIYGDGKFVLNDESEGAKVNKIGVGHYRVLNTEGFHSDCAWGIDGGLSVPKDHNDNPLIWVEPEVNADGSIDIYTFHRENYIPDNIRKMRERRLNKMGGVYASKIDGEPCDIPEGAFIDVRVEMPYNSIYNVKTRAIERVLALENLIRVQQEILNNKTLQLPLL